MGGGQSAPRKVTVENPDDTVIKITENVVDRLQGATKSETRREPTSVASSQPAGVDSVFVTSQAIRREVDKVVTENDAYWESRMKILREGYRKITNELEEEYNKATKEVNQSLGKNLTKGNAVDANSCKKSQASVIECYNQNKNRPLLCANEVQKFNECVSNCTSLTVKTK
ncbi:hypothetical protein V9T40_003932 [Parthenolecanium corni]|uniref:MICOS complex subunit MIC19 n=1 Tax=Parthenolecanium corni TaxID=536013 RepID=A0AAN9Y2Y4_9HEMI